MRIRGNEVWIATGNQGKVREFAALFAPRGIRVRSLKDLGERAPEIVEDGETFAENAIKKASALSETLGIPVIADDSGLCVDALDGRPGVFSARYAGVHASDQDNNRKLLAELAALGLTPTVIQRGEGLPPLRLLSPARFVCAMAFADAVSGETLQTEASVEGMITDTPQGEGGFGYDPLFYIPALGRTTAQLTMEEKNRISHRGKAMRQLMDLLFSSA
jgi:XTP/dITP diphosphohydrolase